MSAAWALSLAAFLLALNAFFVGAEFAILSARRSAIEPLAEAGSRRARTVLWAMEHVTLMLACAQLGVTVCSTTLGLIAEPAIANSLYSAFHSWGLSEGGAHAVAFVIALLIVVYLHVVLGEMVPKNLSVSAPDKAVLWFGPPLVWISRVLRPIIASLDWIANHVIRALGFEPKAEVASAFTVEEVASIVEASRAEGLLADNQGLLTGALEFSTKSAADVMVPIADVVAADANATLDEVEQIITRTGFSRIGIRDHDGELAGYVHLKDVLFVDPAAAGTPVTRMRALTSAAPDDEVEDVLAAMMNSRSHLAVVRAGDRTVGVVFMEDILEELVGEVRDAMQRREHRRN